MTAESPHILIADDEETFRLSTAALLEREGYRCDCAIDAAEAGKLLSGSHDLLISDIRMPGNLNMEFLRDVHARFPLLPILVVTGYPSVDTAVATLRLSFVDYLLKPIDWPELAQSISIALRKGQLARAIRTASEETARAREALEALQEAAVTPGRGGQTQGLAWALDSYVEQTRSQIDTLSLNIKQTFTGVMTGTQTGSVDVCQFMACPRLTAYKAALDDTVEVLERTKHAFKSKDLGELRRRLESLLDEPGT